MVRAFDDRPLPAGTVDRLIELGLHAPSAGFSQGWAFVVLEGPEQTERYWRVTLPPERRADFPWPGLLRAPALIVPLAHAQAYVDRYAEPDKARTGLGRSAASRTTDRTAACIWPMYPGGRRCGSRLRCWRIISNAVSIESTRETVT